jgi:hypothetical protein
MAQPLQLLFANTQGEDAKRWYSQGLSFSPALPDVLLQKKGGPCGVLAALQAHIVLYLTFQGVQSPQQALVESVFEVLLRSLRAPSSADAQSNQATASKVVLFSRRQGQAGPFDPGEELIVESYTDEQTTKARIKELVNTTWASEAGIMLFVLSLLSTRGPARVKSDMDDPEAFMTGQFGHCGQEMLNLILTGQACSQVHDGVVELADTGLHLRGVARRPRVGLLTKLEALRYCQVGSFLKNPEFPVWIIGSESHFTVLYGTDRHCDEKSEDQKIFERGKRAFSSKDTQENGFVKVQELESVIRELGLVPQNPSEERALQKLINKCEMPGSGGIAIWTTFWPVIGPLLREKRTLADVADPSWSCEACTFLNEDADAKACSVCGTQRSPTSLQQRERSKQAELERIIQVSIGPWACSQCTLRNEGKDNQCQACGSSKVSSDMLAETATEQEQGGRKIELVHIDGLEKTIGGKVNPPKKTKLVLTTVDSALAGPGTSGFGAPFEEVLQTKWPGALFDYGPGGQAPTIEG